MKKLIVAFRNFANAPKNALVQILKKKKSSWRTQFAYLALSVKHEIYPGFEQCSLPWVFTEKMDDEYLVSNFYNFVIESSSLSCFLPQT